MNFNEEGEKSQLEPKKINQTTEDNFFVLSFFFLYEKYVSALKNPETHLIN